MTDTSKLFNKILTSNYTFFDTLLSAVQQSIPETYTEETHTAVLEKAKEFYNEYTSQLNTGTKKKKKVKDPNEPTRPKSAYICFSSDKKVRADLKKNKPDMDPKDMISEIGSMWRKMTPKQKQPYEKQAKKCASDYEKLMENYNSKRVDTTQKVIATKKKTTTTATKKKKTSPSTTKKTKNTTKTKNPTKKTVPVS